MLIFIALIAAGALFPRAANVAAWLLTLFFILPFFTFGGGTFIWGVAALWGLKLSWWSAVAFGGAPLGLLISWHILGD